MRTTKDQQRFILLSIAAAILFVIFIFCLQTLYDCQQQSITNNEKQNRIISLRQMLQNIPDETVPSRNQFSVLQKIGQQDIVRITQDKDIHCEITCTYARLLDILQEYAAAPGNIKSLQIVRDKKLLVTILIAGEKESIHE